MLNILLKELERIKGIKSKKIFLERALNQYSDIKIREKIKELMRQIENLDKEKQEKERLQEKLLTLNEELQLHNRINNIARNIFSQVEDAPKYEPRQTENQQARENRERQGFSRLERLADELNPETNARRENLRDYLVRPEERTGTANREYQNIEDLRRDSERLNMKELIKKHDYINPRHEFIPEYNPERANEEEFQRFLTNPKLNERAFEEIKSNYSHDIVENLKKQKKQLEDKYL